MHTNLCTLHLLMVSKREKNVRCLITWTTVKCSNRSKILYEAGPRIVLIARPYFGYFSSVQHSRMSYPECRSLRIIMCTFCLVEWSFNLIVRSLYLVMCISHLIIIPYFLFMCFYHLVQRSFYLVLHSCHSVMCFFLIRSFYALLLCATFRRSRFMCSFNALFLCALCIRSFYAVFVCALSIRSLNALISWRLSRCMRIGKLKVSQ